MKTNSSRFFEMLIGLGLTGFVLCSYVESNVIFKDPALFSGPGIFSWLESLEFKLYDVRSKFRTSIDAGSNEIVIVSIDDDSLTRLGRWPWHRDLIAKMVDLLAAAKPKILGVEIVYSEPEDSQGSQEIAKLRSEYQNFLKSHRITQKHGVNYSGEFDSALNDLNYDTKLADSFAKAGNVILPFMFTGGGLQGAKPEAMPPTILGSALRASPTDDGLGLGRADMEGLKPVVPIPAFATAAKGVGHVNIYPDFDGVVRRDYPVVKYNGSYYPSFALQLVIRYLGFGPKDVVVTPGKSIDIGKNSIPLNDNQSLLISFSGPSQTFRSYSFYDVLNGKVAMDVFKDKIVLVGLSAEAVSTLFVTPVGHNLPNAELMSNIVENMLHRRFLVRPNWGFKFELGSIAFGALFLMFVLPFLNALWGAVTTLILLGLFGSAGTYYFIGGLWLKIAYPCFLLAVGYVFITTKRFFSMEKGKERIEASAVETNKMLGLSFQGQGMLDLAFEKFRLCPLDEAVKELLYNLGLDFERKRQFNKAVAVYEYISSTDANYKDIEQKVKVLTQASEGTIFGAVGGKQADTVLVTSAGVSKPTLGRYEVEKEIGRGAMGIVYLGNDPKINRKVAIKTMTLQEGKDATAMKETRERFFREAESAGTLNHPNIVRIFDAGEEHDVAYIAMEFLDGYDLTKHIAAPNLLPRDVVIEYVARVADALDYASAQGIIHRDIKPANIMLLKDNSIRVTDFGIARITASSKTATGTVVGTPAYMSPEQVSGKKVDGRSDIFSLGIVLFELLLGQKPFRAGDGGLGTLLFSIANDPEPEPMQLDPTISQALSTIIHNALKKDSDQRYQRGRDMAADLRACLKSAKEEETVLPEPPLPKAATQSPEKFESTLPPGTMPIAPTAMPSAVPSPPLEFEPILPIVPTSEITPPPPPLEPILTRPAAPVPVNFEPPTFEATLPVGMTPPPSAPPPPPMDTPMPSAEEIAASIARMAGVPQKQPTKTGFNLPKGSPSNPDLRSAEEIAASITSSSLPEMFKPKEPGSKTNPPGQGQTPQDPTKKNP